MRIIIILFYLILSTQLMYSEEFSNGSDVLKIYPSTKGISLGNSLVADSSIDTLYYNPAGLSLLNDKGAGFNFLSVMNKNINQFNVHGYFKFNNSNVIGFSVFYIDYGSFPMTSIRGTYTGIDFSAFDVINRIALAKSFFRRRLLLGISVFIFFSKIDHYSGTGYGTDIGFQYLDLFPNLNVGFSIKNLGSGIKFIEKTSIFPYLLNSGLKYLIFGNSEKKNNLLTVYLNYSYEFLNHFSGVSCGIEYGLFKICYFRMGYGFFKNNIYNLSMGLGLKYSWGNFNPELDISLMPETEFGNKLSLSFFVYF